jgi:glycosyltransferase involved in cell wall biosynthesis
MKVLLMYDYPPGPGGLSTQGDLLFQGLKSIGVEVHAAHYDSPLEKEWYYRNFQPDVAVGVGYWGYTPQLVLHPRKFGILPVPWLVADGYVANYQDVLNKLPLILVTSAWVKEMYIRDGINGDNIEILPIGCNTSSFAPVSRDHPKVQEIRASLGIEPDELMLLTIGGDACSKGAREVMQALAELKDKVPKYKYVCKVWPQQRTAVQNELDKALAEDLGLHDKVRYVTSVISRSEMPYLINACDIYVGPSRLEGFGMTQVEASACEKPVIGIKAMGMLDTLVHEETALLADVAEHIIVKEVTLGAEAGYKDGRKIVFDTPRTVDYRAKVSDIQTHLYKLMNDIAYANRLGKAGRQRVLEKFDYREVARQFVKLINTRLNIY